MSWSELKVDAVILACAVSAGVHGALVPDHFREGAWPGAGFVAATILLAAAAVVLTLDPNRLALLATAALFAGLVASYAAAVRTGIPVLHPEREAVDGLALGTNAVEICGLFVAFGLARRPSPFITLRPKGTLA